MRTLLSFLLACFLITLHAQSPQFIHYTPGRQINDMAKDGEFLWLATNGGVVQINTLDGETNFYNRSNSGLPINEITSIAIAPDGTRWLGTRIGLVRWQGNDFTVLNPTGSGGNPVQLWILKVRIDGVGHAWVSFPGHNANMARFDGQNWLVVDEESLFNGSADFTTNPQASGICVFNDDEKKFYRYDGSTLSTHPLPDEVEGNFVNDWLLDEQGEIWVVSGNQLVVSQGSNWAVEEIDIWPDALALDEVGALWIASDFDGIYKRLPDGSWQTGYGNYLPFDTYEMYFDVSPSGTAWFGTEEKGLYRLANGSLEKMPSAVADIPEGGVVQLEVTGTQTVWAIFDDQYILDWLNGKDLSRFQDQQWKAIDEGVLNQPFWKCKSLAKDGLDRLWVAHFDQIYRYNGTWEQISKPAEFNFGQVYSVAAEPNTNHVWIGGYGKIARYDGVGFQVFNAPIPTFSVEDLCIDQQGNVWLPGGVTSGLAYRFDGQSWTSYTNQEMGLSEFSFFAREIKVAPNGDVWVLTPYELTRYNGSNWEKFPLEAYQYGEFSTMAFDGSEKIWIGTFHFLCFGVDANLQLIKIENESVHFYPYKSTPLPYPNITALAVDAHHNVWIGCEKGGIAVFNENGVTLNVGEAIDDQTKQRMPATVFPNPAGTQTTLEYTLPSASEVMLEIRDAAGRLLLRQSGGIQLAGVQRWRLSLQHLPTGTLHWRLVSDDALATGWLLKQR
ncbi:MAG: hypothetical protein J0M29_09940 [Chitinophagales bacterium]|nr:hypothetical protein [Chitinophagales bacterium]